MGVCLLVLVLSVYWEVSQNYALESVPNVVYIRTEGWDIWLTAQTTFICIFILGHLYLIMCPYIQEDPLHNIYYRIKVKAIGSQHGCKAMLTIHNYENVKPEKDYKMKHWNSTTTSWCWQLNIGHGVGNIWCKLCLFASACITITFDPWPFLKQIFH